jgi:hypothetical protein
MGKIIYLGIYNESLVNENGFMQFWNFHRKQNNEVLYYSFKELFFYVPFVIIKFLNIKLLIPKVKIPKEIDILVMDSSPWTIVYHKAIINYIKPNKVIYRQSDPIGEISGYSLLESAESQLIKSCDKVFYVNRMLKNRFGVGASSSFVIRNPEKINLIPNKDSKKEFKAIYYGKLQIDYLFIKNLALLNPKLKIEIYGNYKSNNNFPSNVFFMGYQSLEQIHKSLEGAMFFLLPYDDINPVVKYLGVSSKVINAIINCCIILSNKSREALNLEGIDYLHGEIKLDIKIYNDTDFSKNKNIMKSQFSISDLSSKWINTIENYGK